MLVGGYAEVSCFRWTGSKLLPVGAAFLEKNFRFLEIHFRCIGSLSPFKYAEGTGDSMDVVTHQDRKRRMRDFASLDRAQDKAEQAKRRQNRDFVQVYPKGFQRLRALMDSYPLAAKIYAFLAEHIEQGTGAVVVSQELLAEEMHVTTRSIRTATAYLDEVGAVVRIKLGGSAIYAYALDPEEIWKTFDDAKEYAAFKTQTLARKRDNGDVKRKLKVMMKGQLESESPDAEVDDD
jgi:ribosomal protein S21